MTERRVSVRLAAVGGQVLKADLREIGREGRAALEAIGAAGAPASRGLDDVGASASAAITRFEALSARAAQAAVNLRAAAASTGTLAGRIDQLTGVSSGSTAAPRISPPTVPRSMICGRGTTRSFAAIRNYRGALDDIRQAHRVGAISADEMTAAIGRERTAALANIAALKGRTTALGQMGGASRLASYQSRNLIYQLNDVGVSLASGMNPMMVFIQQGSQIAQTYAGQGGVNAALKQTAGLVLGVARAHPVATAAMIASTVALAGLKHEISEASGVTVGFGDTALAVWQVIRDGLVSVLKPAIDAIAPWFSAAWDVVVAGVHVTGNAIINGFRLAIETVKRLFAALPLIAGAAVIGAANAVLTGIEKLITAALARMNGFIQTVSGLVAIVPGMDGFSLGEIAPPPPLPKIDNSYAADLTAAWQDFERVHAEIQASDPLGDFFDAVKVRAVKNALDDTAEAAGGAGAAMKKAGGAAKDGMEAAKTSVDTLTDAPGEVRRGREGRRKESRRQPRRRLHLGRGGGGQLREDRQARHPRSRHLDAGRSRQALGEAGDPRPARGFALRSVRRGGRLADRQPRLDLRRALPRRRPGRRRRADRHSRRRDPGRTPLPQRRRLRPAQRRAGRRASARRAGAEPPPDPGMGSRRRAQHHHQRPRRGVLPAIAVADRRRHRPRRRGRAQEF